MGSTFNYTDIQFILASIICFMSGGICFKSFHLLIFSWDWRHYDIVVFITHTSELWR